MEQKRILLFLAAVAFTTFFINIGFQYLNTGKLQEWNQQQVAKKSQKIKQLEYDIAKRSAKPSELPLVDIFADVSGQDFLSTGILDSRFIMTLPWNQEPPQKIYARRHGKEESAK